MTLAARTSGRGGGATHLHALEGHLVVKCVPGVAGLNRTVHHLLDPLCAAAPGAHRARLRRLRRTTLRMRLQSGIFLFPVLGFWGKHTMVYAGTMAYRRDLSSTTSEEQRKPGCSFILSMATVHTWYVHTWPNLKNSFCRESCANPKRRRIPAICMHDIVRCPG